jgi:hypothetical protein
MSSSPKIEMRNKTDYLKNTNGVFTVQNLKNKYTKHNNKKKYNEYKQKSRNCREKKASFFSKEQYTEEECKRKYSSLAEKHKYTLLSYMYSKYKSKAIKKINNINNDEDIILIAKYIKVLENIFNIYRINRKININTNPFEFNSLINKIKTIPVEQGKEVNDGACITYMTHIFTKTPNPFQYISKNKNLDCKDRLIKIITDKNTELPNI